MAALSFTPFQSRITAEFWQTLSTRKIDLEKLDTRNVRCFATYELSAPRPRLDITENAYSLPSSSRRIAGYVRTCNSLDDFKKYDKNAFINDIAQQVFEAIDGGALEEPWKLSAFGILCYADLKGYKYTYWVCHPCIPSSWTYSSRQGIIVEETINESFFIYTTNGIGPLSEWTADSVFGFQDGASDESLGWTVRNYLVFIHQKLGLSTFSLLAYRGRRSVMMQVTLLKPIEKRMIGWERNMDKLVPKYVDLSTSLDPEILATRANDLNLKLMKWRIEPDLDLAAMAKYRCLILGAGTLGCQVGRLLLAWNITHITFIDSSRVSYSNPARQGLYRARDAVAGDFKAERAAKALKEIYHGVNASGHVLSIPMIGHPIPPKSDYEDLERLIASHDAIFLLLDSRESRWLPSVLASSMGKILINAALGFDSFLVLRHGHADQGRRMGCYFCNDIVGPMNSMADRTLDQMCTVTRPGLANIAAGYAVEILASISQHLRGSDEDGVLGVLPHTIRGSLRKFEIMRGSSVAHDACSACSPAIIEGYREGGWEFVRRALGDPAYVEALSGLSALREQVDELNLNWSEEEDDL